MRRKILSLRMISLSTLIMLLVTTFASSSLEENQQKLRGNLEGEENEQDNIEKLRQVYEHKIRLYEETIRKQEDRIITLSLELEKLRSVNGVNGNKEHRDDFEDNDNASSSRGLPETKDNNYSHQRHLHYEEASSDVDSRRVNLLDDIDDKRKEWKGRPIEKSTEVTNKERQARQRRVILKYKHNAKKDAIDVMMQADENQIKLGNPKSSVHYDFNDYDTLVITATEDEINELQNNEMFISVENDVERYVIPDVPDPIFKSGSDNIFSKDRVSDIDSERRNSTRSRRRKLSQEVPYGIQLINALDAHLNNFKGQGVKVCVIDSGINSSLSDFSNSHLSGLTESDDYEWSEDGCSHGTHVAGTIAANDNDFGVVGVAPKADLHIIRVFDNSCHWRFSSDIVYAAIKCKEAGAKIISMSLGGSGRSNSEEDTLESLKNDHNIVSVAAAGNTGDSSHFYPAAYDCVISVSAVQDDRTVAPFSTRNDKVTISAPGRHVTSTLPDGGYGAKSGTSMAAPHVSGVVALMLQANPDLRPHEIQDAMCNTAQNRPQNGRNDTLGCGIVDAKAALENVLGQPLDARCTNDPVEWYDSGGPDWSCSAYERSPNYCSLYGGGWANADFHNQIANDACCICGGGLISGNGIPTPDPTRRPTEQPTPSPTSLPSLSTEEEEQEGSCSDLQHEFDGNIVDFFDVDGPNFNCKWYEKSIQYCEWYGNMYKNINANPPMVANEACCFCGGGNVTISGRSNNIDNNPTSSPSQVPITPTPTILPATPSPTTPVPTSLPTTPPPTIQPTPSPTQCQDMTLSNGIPWHDGDDDIDNDHVYDCNWYRSKSNCVFYGNDYTNDGKTANEACCICGGGAVTEEYGG